MEEMVDSFLLTVNLRQASLIDGMYALYTHTNQALQKPITLHHII